MNGFVENVRRLGPTRLLLIGTLGAALLAAFFVLAQRVGAPKMALLYGDLTVEDSSEIVVQLEAQGVPFELEANGRRIMVPRDRALRLRLAMAREGLPAGGSVGYELFDKGESLGSSSFVQNINRLRALEGELSRTIRSIDRIAAARVHLVLPRREVFARERRRPSASIAIRMRGASRLDAGQVRAMQHLVASAVPDLEPERVSIVDQQGQLLSRAGKYGGAGASGLADARTAQEGRLKDAIESLVEQSLGVGRVRAEVSVDMDLDRITTKQEIYDPESQVARSTQTLEETTATSESEADTSITVANNLPEAEAGEDASNESQTQRTEETVNYEISKTTKTQIHESGRLKRISVAVLVDGAYTTGQDGAMVYAPRKQDELDKIATLVKSTIGFDQGRGDTVEVVNMRFQRFQEPLEDTVVGFEVMGFEIGDVMRAAEMVALVLVALLTLLFIARPLLAAIPSTGGAPAKQPALAAPEAAAALPAPAASGMPAAEREAIIAAVEAGEMRPEEARRLLTGESTSAGEDNEVMIDIARIEGQVRASSVRKIGELVEQHPDEALSILRTWLYQES